MTGLRKRSEAKVRRRSAAAGFTLVEMLVTLAILGGLAAGTAVALGPVRDRSLIARSSATITEMVARARATAIRDGRPTLLRFDSERHAVSIVGTAMRVRLDPAVTLVVTTAREAGAGLDHSILFLPDGTGSGARLRLLVSDRVGAARTLRISWLTGVVVDER